MRWAWQRLYCNGEAWDQKGESRVPDCHWPSSPLPTPVYNGPIWILTISLVDRSFRVQWHSYCSPVAAVSIDERCQHQVFVICIPPPPAAQATTTGESVQLSSGLTPANISPCRSALHCPPVPRDQSEVVQRSEAEWSIQSDTYCQLRDITSSAQYGPSRNGKL